MTDGGPSPRHDRPIVPILVLRERTPNIVISVAHECTKDQPLFPLGTEDRLGQSFDFQNQCQLT
jgi:hypothetical protein